MYASIGRLLFKLALPAMRLALRHTTRVYVVIEHQGRVLFVKNWLSEQDWRLPGGGKHVHESWVMAGLREVHEELGFMLDQKSLKDLSEGVWETNGFNYQYKILHINCAEIPKVKRAYFELIAVKWLDPKQLKGEITPEIFRALMAAGLI